MENFLSIENTLDAASRKRKRIIVNIITIAGMLACLGFIVYGIKTRIFYSEIALGAFLARFGLWAPIIFVVFQATQVVFPVLPGGIGLLGGTLIFGGRMGFLYNYIGICLGSAAAFLIAKKYGIRVLDLLFSSKLRKKYMHWTEDRRFSVLFAIAIFMPVAPDDYLCYLAGTTNMSLKKFTAIILLCKPFTLAVYSFGLNAIFRQVMILIH